MLRKTDKWLAGGVGGGGSVSFLKVHSRCKCAIRTAGNMSRVEQTMPTHKKYDLRKGRSRSRVVCLCLQQNRLLDSTKVDEQKTDCRVTRSGLRSRHATPTLQHNTEQAGLINEGVYII